MVRILLFSSVLLTLPACGTRHGSQAAAPSDTLPIGTGGPAPSISPLAMGRRPDPSPALYIPGKDGDGEERALPVPPPSLTFTTVEPQPALPGDAPPPVPPPPVPPPGEAPPPPLPPPVPMLDPPVPGLPPPSGTSPLRELHLKALKTYATMDTYIMRLKRREVVSGSPRPEEIMLCKVRKEPFSVYFKWLGPEGNGREVIFVKGQHGNLIHSLTATGDVLFLPGGKRFKVAPDSFLVKSKSRHPITTAGLGPMIERFGRLVDAVERDDPREGTVKFLGEQKRPEFEEAVVGVLQAIPPKSDPLLPRGGQRQWYFDTKLGLPVLFITQDDTGREVEYYCHDRFMIPANLGDEDFNPDLLWKTD